MKVTFLGTGTSQGVPFIGCSCPVCLSQNKKDKRLRSSIWLHDESHSIVIDTGPDFRYQMLRAGVPRLDGIIFTHGHKDHTAGLDDVRAFNYWQKQSINLYMNQGTEEIIRREFQYVFNSIPYPGIPRLEIISIADQASFNIKDLTFEIIKVKHFKMEVYGFRLGDFAYITDANYIAPEEMDKLKGVKTLVLTALRKEKHISHFHLPESIRIAQALGVQSAYFTHISHQLGLAEEVEKELPENMHLAYDGLTIDL